MYNTLFRIVINNKLMENPVNERIKGIVAYSGKTINSLSKELKVSQPALRSIIVGLNNPGFEMITKLIDLFPEVSIDWLISGKGPMLKSDNSTPVASINHDGIGIPYYADLPVSAGQLETFMQDAAPTGWVNLPGVTSKALFPVIGCSMQPEINPGDVVGIIQLDSWEIIDPDKVYLIITHDERMIKHLAADEEDDSILWCLSPSYPKFQISKSDIKFLYRISFCGKLM